MTTYRIGEKIGYCVCHMAVVGKIEAIARNWKGEVPREIDFDFI